MGKKSEGGWIMTIQSPFQIRVKQIIDQQFSQVPDFTKEEILDLRDKGSKGDQMAMKLFHPLWSRYVDPVLDEFYESEEGKIMWRQHCLIHGDDLYGQGWGGVK